MKKHIFTAFAAAAVLTLAACSASDSETSTAEETSAVSGSFSESSDADMTSQSFIGKWYFIQMDYSADEMPFSMSLKDMDITELTEENSFYMDLSDDGTIAISSYGSKLSAEWTFTDGGFAVTGDTEALGADNVDFSALDTDLIKSDMTDGEESWSLYFAKEGSPRIDESINTSLFEQALGEIMGSMIDENTAELTLDAPLTLTFDENSGDIFCRFTAPESGTYTFRSESDGYDSASVYDSTSFADALDTSSNTKGGFELSVTLEADSTVYIDITSDSSEVKVTAEKN